MFDVNADPSVVTATIERDLAEARRESAQRREQESETASAATAAEETAGAQVVVPAVTSAPPVDAETLYRRGRLGVVAALVLVLLWVWILQRRNEGKRK